MIFSASFSDFFSMDAAHFCGSNLPKRESMRDWEKEYAPKKRDKAVIRIFAIVKV
jgi:hypothetical protein